MKPKIPNPFKRAKDAFVLTDEIPSGNYVESGVAALKYLIRSTKTAKGSRVAIPAFVCDSVRKAVVDEGYEPVPLDLKTKHTFWTDYNGIEEKNVQLVVLVHLFGLLHPDTAAIIKDCNRIKVPLIHDCAQSYFINESVFNENSSIFYSFNIGKTCSGGGGALVKCADFTLPIHSNNLLKLLLNLRAQILIRSRVVGNSFDFHFFEKLLDFVTVNCYKIGIINSDKIYAATALQKRVIKNAIDTVSEHQHARIQYWKLLTDALKSNDSFELLNSEPGNSPYKVVFKVESKQRSKLLESLVNKGIPFVNLFSSNQNIQNCNNFNLIAHQIIELSCEYTLVQSDVNKMIQIIESF